MSNLSDLKDALVTAAADITNTIERLECLADIDSWYPVRQAVDALASTSISSYSIAGRTITRTQLPALRIEERTLYARIMERLYCRGSGLIDVRDPVPGSQI